MIRMDVGRNIAEQRKKRGLTQENIAESTGVSRQAVANWERGESLPELEKLLALSRLFSVTLDTLVNRKEPCSPSSGGEPLPGGDLKAFLCRAKRSTYAGKGAEVSPSRPGSHDLEYSEGDLFYYDTYLGGEQFAGEEALWTGGVPFWSMNYKGRVTGKAFSGDFLKECLSRVEPKSPFRGPALHRAGEYTYCCRWEGAFEWFAGSEEIFYDNRRVYECLFHGGIIK